MANARWSLDKEISAYLGELEDGGRSPLTIQDYRWALNHLFNGLEDAKMTLNPRKVGKAEIEYLRNDYLTQCNRTKANLIKILMGFLKWTGNQQIAKIRLCFGDTSPKNIRWLSDHEARTVRENAVGIEKMVVHCELDLGMRRCEVLRLKVNDFQRGRNNAIFIHGKGRNGGKFRQISWHPETMWMLDDFLIMRQAEIEKAKMKNRAVQVPEALFIYERGGKLHSYKKTAIDDILTDLGNRVGIKFSNHDLRRTCGRMMYRAGVQLEEIARIFGHSDTRTTAHYIGLDFEDMSAAMSKYAQYQNMRILPQMVKNELSQEKSGQSGI